MDLKAVPLSQIENTFPKYERTLHKIIQMNTHVLDRMIIPDIDFLTVLWILVTEVQKMCMYDTIRLKFHKFLGDSAISNVSYDCACHIKPNLMNCLIFSMKISYGNY